MKPPTIELNNPKNQHIVWLDVVRLIAMFTVVCCHCTDPFNFYPGTAPNIWEIKLWGAIYGAVLRPCVPLFVMITGALLLPVSVSTCRQRTVVLAATSGANSYGPPSGSYCCMIRVSASPFSPGSATPDNRPVPQTLS